MKYTFLLVLMCSLLAGQAQTNKSRWRNRAETAAQLAWHLTAHQQNEKEKVSAIFGWITLNIGYHTRPWNQGRSLPAMYDIEDPSDTATVLKPLDERVADLVIQRGEAYCDGYARLFKTLCGYAGVQAEVITGFARTGMDKGGTKFKSNHTWNAVRIDSMWHLLDVTWASGFLTYSGNEFIRRYDPSYYLTPPRQFIADHYPEDLQWTLLQDPPQLNEYKLSPFKQQGFIRAKINSFKPERGLIRVSIGDTVVLEVNSEIQKPDPMRGNWKVDNSRRATPASWTYLVPTSAIDGKLVYTFVVESLVIEYLNLVYDDNVLMRYKLDIVPPPVQSLARTAH